MISGGHAPRLNCHYSISTNQIDELIVILLGLIRAVYSLPFGEITAAKEGWDGKISGSKDATRDKKRIDQRDQSSMRLRNTRFQSVKVLDHINTI